MLKDKNKVKELINGLMDPLMKVNGSITKSMGRGFTNGLMAGFTMANGLITKCKATESIDGQMVEYTKVNIFVTKSMAMERIHGQMVEYMMVLGKKVNNMVKVNTLTRREMLGAVFGRVENALNGLKT